MAEPITVASAQYDDGDAFPNTLGFDAGSPVAPAPRDLAAATYSDDDALPILENLPGSTQTNDDAVPISAGLPNTMQSSDGAEAFGMDGLKFPPQGAVMDIEGHYLFVCT